MSMRETIDVSLDRTFHFFVEELYFVSRIVDFFRTFFIWLYLNLLLISNSKQKGWLNLVKLITTDGQVRKMK